MIAEKTTIPVPKIVAYALGDGDDPLSSFLILEYVQGRHLSFGQLGTLSETQQTRLYTSLADIYIQLRRLEFRSIGRLTHDPAHPGEYQVGNQTTSIDINAQELEGLQPSEVQAAYCNNPDGVLASANQYVAMLLDIADNAFIRGPRNVWEQSQGEEALYHLAIFREYAEKWVDPRLDGGPFVLVHGDLEPFNLIVNDNLDVVSVLDWEWSRVVPLQFFNPPLWFGVPDTTKLAYSFVYRDYLSRFHRFLAIVRSREEQLFDNVLLAEEWAKAEAHRGFLVANALENWTDMDWFAFRYINLKCYGGKRDLSARVKAYIEEDPARHELIRRKVAERIAYRAAELGEDQEGQSDGATAANSGGNTPLKHTKSLADTVIAGFLPSPYQPWKAVIAFLPSIPMPALGSIAMIAAGTVFLVLRRGAWSLRPPPS